MPAAGPTVSPRTPQIREIDYPRDNADRGAPYKTLALASCFRAYTSCPLMARLGSPLSLVG
ncbi:hypothetical protein ACRE_029060 [Hapsidospora chrysogenum ATCC 11550]|uniref:Uncharacterized protein n=1 Tax=Hapsidospora chrysogenum (strain ATCC 11550 / CBS 779.69 / DSM 880 / IAM 14645 / JCM 23072 / IMI 49137) TaxID=857340 RepID=A0A086TAB8_HAPC1|nr:hypothetical protein ACRE_029060 [Hapsidospora chrysogenum ATCC 11550]